MLNNANIINLFFIYAFFVLKSESNGKTYWTLTCAVFTLRTVSFLPEVITAQPLTRLHRMNDNERCAQLTGRQVDSAHPRTVAHFPTPLLVHGVASGVYSRLGPSAAERSCDYRRSPTWQPHLDLESGHKQPQAARRPTQTPMCGAAVLCPRTTAPPLQPQKARKHSVFFLRP